jgi:hypothetical protein
VIENIHLQKYKIVIMINAQKAIETRFAMLVVEHNKDVEIEN